MTHRSVAGTIARITIVTSVVATLLILLATFASSMGNRTSATNSSWTDESRSVGGSVAAYAPAPTMSRPTEDVDAYDSGSLVEITAEGSRVIKTGSIDMTSYNVSKTVSDISALAIARQGYVQSSSTNDDEIGYMSSYVTVRVPSSGFEDAMTAIKTLGVHVNSESVSGEDVTEYYTDVSARLTAAQAQEAQYLIILEDAETVGEVLAVQEHLATVRAEIESLQGQINYLENRTDLATISVSVSEETSPASAGDNKFDPGRDADEALAFVIALGQHALTVLIWIAIIGSAIAVPVGIAGLIYWIVAGRRSASPKRRK